MEKYDVIVVGAGAAGLLCSGYLARGGKTVLLLEKNDRVGRKLMITGKGRCNLTNNCTPEDFLKSVCTNGKFLQSAIHQYPPENVMELLESLGVPLKTERGDRVFPVSDQAVDVVDALDGFARGKNVTRAVGECSALLFSEGVLEGVVCEEGSRFYAAQVVVATGGLSYPMTGSTGTGYRLATQAGHTLMDPKPSLVPIVVQEDYCRDMMGLSLKNVVLSLYEGEKKKPLYTEMGEMLFTHFGVSGPLVLSASCFMRKPAPQYRLTIDLKPGLTVEQLDKRLRRDFTMYSNRDFINSLDQLLPRKMISVVAKTSGIPFDCKVNQITKEQRTTLCNLLKAFPLTPKALRPVEEGVVTAGGVSVKELNPKTMESKLIHGLYFVGEVLDLDAYTGGFNLQIAFSTAFCAAKHLTENQQQEGSK